MGEHKKGKWFGWRMWGILAVVAAVLVGALWVALQPKAPVFSRVVPKGQEYTFVGYPALHSVPFSGGLTWVEAAASNNELKTLLLDIKSGVILGEFENAQVLLVDGTRGKAVVRTKAEVASPFHQNLVNAQERVLRRRLRLTSEENYWSIDLNSGKATLLGRIEPRPSLMNPSPDFTRGYVDALGQRSATIFDLSKEKAETHTLPGICAGWWDNARLLGNSYEDGDIWLYDTTTRENRELISGEELERWFREKCIHANLQELFLFPVWNGTSFEFYLTESRSKWFANTTFLARFNQNGNLDLITSVFRYGFEDDLHPTEPLHAFSGWHVLQFGALGLKNIESGEAKLIIPAGGSDVGGIRFYNDQIVFVRSNMLWKTDLRGWNITLLFPPSNEG